MASYPFLMTVGTMGVGERFGTPSANRREAYLYPALASLAAVGASAAAGAAAFSYSSGAEDVAAGIFLGIVPNAFLNAYVYNRVKKPATDDISSRLSVAPYVASYRVGRGGSTPVYGLTLSF
jgi:hypothetical protein